MDFPDDRSLVQRVLQGDLDAYGEIVRRHQKAVFNSAYRVLGNLHDAEDATQETFLRAYQFLHSFESDRPLAPWLKRIAVNVSLNRLEIAQPAASLDEESMPSGTEAGPEAQSVKRDRDERIRSELNRLPPRYRAVIELRHFHDLRYEQIARLLHRPLSDVKSDLFRARKLLAERLKDLA